MIIQLPLELVADTLLDPEDVSAAFMKTFGVVFRREYLVVMLKSGREIHYERHEIPQVWNLLQRVIPDKIEIPGKWMEG